MAEETVVIRFVGDASSIEAAAGKATEAVEGVESKAKSAGGGFDALTEIATGAMRKIGEAAMDALGSGLSALGGFVKDSISEASDWQNALAQTNAVIASTGGVAGKTADDLANLASDMSAASGQSLFSDDAILGAENVLATFTAIKGVNFDSATSAILDVSQALGQDLKSTTIQVGKALNDPINGITALSRVGVSFTEQQKAQIKAMQEAGNVAGAQKVILAELNKEFGGSAAAAVDTYAGQMKVLDEQFKDVKQSVGEALLPILKELGNAAVTYVVPAVQTMADAFVNFVDSVDWVGLQSLIGTTFQSISTSVTSVDWNGIFASIGDAIGWVMDTSNQLGDTFNRVVDAIMVQVNGFWGVVGPIWNQFTKVLSDAGKELAPLGDIASKAFGDIGKQSDTMAPIGEFLGNIVKAILNVVGTLVTVLVPVIKFVFPIIVDSVKNAVDSFMMLYNTIQYVFSGKLQQDITTWWSVTITAISQAITSVVAKATQMGRDIMQGVINGVAAMEQKLRDTFASIVNGAVAWLKKLLGIASPSKLMADTIGVPLGQGIAAGVLQASSDLRSAMSASVGSAVGATSSTVQNFYLSATYATAQSQSDLVSDVRAMQILAGGV